MRILFSRLGFNVFFGQARLLAGLLAALCATPLAHAAGGHHAVDDAAVLAPGECQLETWFERAHGGARRLLHAGPACRVGAVELELNLDRSRAATTGSVLAGGAQLKWAQPLGPNLSAGVLVAATAQEGAPRFAGSRLVIPVTWRPGTTLQVHANLGRDFRHLGPDASRAGAALEWAPSASWSFVGERFRETGANFHRLGARYALGPTLQADISRTWGRNGQPGGWTAGLNWFFAGSGG